MRQLVGKKLHELHRGNDEKLTTIEAEIGISRGTFSKIENGNYPALKVGILEDIAIYYGVSITYFIDADVKA